MPLIAKILLKQKTENKLYKSLMKKEEKDDGGFGKCFEQRTRISEVSEAFEIDDAKKTVSVKSVSALYKLATKFKKGNPPSVPANPYQQAICLALICSEEKLESGADLRTTTRALEKLKKLYGDNGPLKDQQVSGISGVSVLDLIERKLAAHRSTLDASVVPAYKITKVGKGFKNSSHAAEIVVIGGRRFVRKKDVEPRVAGLEVFSGTMMELFIGPHQPSTRQVKGREVSASVVSILSEEVALVPFTTSALTTWADDGFPGAAEIDVANLFMAEDDYHRGNGGTVLVGSEEKTRAVRIDFDRTIAPLSLPLLGPEWVTRPKTQCLEGKQEPVTGLTHLEGLEIHEDDLANLPLLPNVTTSEMKADELKQHYIPNNWWAYDTTEDTPVNRKIRDLNKNPKYKNDKFQAILEKIIMPDAILKTIANETIFNLEDKEKVSRWMALRQKKMSEVAVKVPGFIEFVLSKGGDAKDKLKEKFQVFARKRDDIFTDSVGYFAGLYDVKFNVFLEQVKLLRLLRPIVEKVPEVVPPVSVRRDVERLPSSSPLSPVSEEKEVESPRNLRIDVPSPSSSPSSSRLIIEVLSPHLPSIKNVACSSPVAEYRALPSPSIVPKKTFSLANFMLSALGTGGAALGGLAVLGVINAWNPLGWAILGGAALLGSAVAMGVINKSVKWGILGFLPGINLIFTGIKGLYDYCTSPKKTYILTPAYQRTPSPDLTPSPIVGSPSRENHNNVEEKKEIDFVVLAREENEQEIKADFIKARCLSVSRGLVCAAQTKYSNHSDLKFIVDTLMSAASMNSVPEQQNILMELRYKVILGQILEDLQSMPLKLSQPIYTAILDKRYDAAKELATGTSIVEHIVNLTKPLVHIDTPSVTSSTPLANRSGMRVG